MWIGSIARMHARILCSSWTLFRLWLRMWVILSVFGLQFGLHFCSFWHTLVHTWPQDTSCWLSVTLNLNVLDMLFRSFVCFVLCVPISMSLRAVTLFTRASKPPFAFFSPFGKICCCFSNSWKFCSLKAFIVPDA